MKIFKPITAIAAVTLMMTAHAGDLDISEGNWQITFDESGKTLTYAQDGNTLIKGAYVTATDLSGDILESKSYPTVKLTRTSVTDGFGSGKKFTYTYSGLSGKNNLEHNIYIYSSLPYILVEASVVSASGEASVIEICPVVSKTTTTLPLPTSNNRVYDMPFANDNWATFSTNPWQLGQPMTSCEATALFNVDNRNGIIIGSVDHSTWKSAVSVTPNSSNRVRALTLQAGYISSRTWDIINDKASSTHHGAVKGTRVDSPKFMIGLFGDWREGLETYGDANTVLCPRMEWTKDESLFGWQSWGGMEFGLNYTSAMSVLDFFERELLPVGFHNKEKRCHIVLDSGWDALNDNQLRQFANRCKELGLVAGIYTTPFSYWGSEDDAIQNKEWEGGNLGEMILKANGRYRQISGMSLDPTHPKVKEWNRKRFEKFRNLGFEFVKIDFMNNGSQEADSWYDPDITTGMQAYNYGLDYIVEFAGDMMIDFSIAPVFPAKAHVRRIGCDAWGDLPQSMYTLNCINGSWWLDHVYAFNDPDHMCLSKVPFSGKGSNDEQEARIRYTCGLMTGMTLLGGTYAYEGDTKGDYGHVIGSDEERARAVKFASNKDLTLLGQQGRTFRPVEGTFNYHATLWSKDDVSVDNEFILDTSDAFYYIVFNFGTETGAAAIDTTPDYSRLGIDPSQFTNVTELWSGETFSPSSLQIKVPVKDVRIYRFEKPGFGGVDQVEADTPGSVEITAQNGSLLVEAAGGVAHVEVYSIEGSLIASQPAGSASRAVRLAAGVGNHTPAVVRVTLASGDVQCQKVLLR